jgi:hypothetical protein
MASTQKPEKTGRTGKIRVALSAFQERVKFKAQEFNTTLKSLYAIVCTTVGFGFAAVSFREYAVGCIVWFVCAVMVIVFFWPPQRSSSAPAKKLGSMFYGFVFLVVACSWTTSYKGDEPWSNWLRSEELSEAPTPASAEPNLAIFAKCDLAALPMTVPARGAMRIVPLNEKYMRSFQWGSYEVRNDGAQPMQWPDKRVLEEAEKKKDMGGFGYKCEVSNRGSVTFWMSRYPCAFGLGARGERRMPSSLRRSSAR